MAAFVEDSVNTGMGMEIGSFPEGLVFRGRGVWIGAALWGRSSGCHGCLGRSVRGRAALRGRCFWIGAALWGRLRERDEISVGVENIRALERLRLGKAVDRTETCHKNRKENDKDQKCCSSTKNNQNLLHKTKLNTQISQFLALLSNRRPVRLLTTQAYGLYIALWSY